jgi:hypothetical protein
MRHAQDYYSIYNNFVWVKAHIAEQSNTNFRKDCGCFHHIWNQDVSQYTYYMHLIVYSVMIFNLINAPTTGLQKLPLWSVFHDP